MRLLPLILSLAAAVAPLGASTIERLDMDEMIAKSTAIVRARAVDTYSATSGRMVYTVTRVSVLEQWKGPEAAEIEVAVPGGTYGGLRQTFSGAPELEPGKEYVLFLWTGTNGITQVIGLSQGVFTVETNEDGLIVVERPSSGAIVLDNGIPANDEPLSLPLDRLRGRVEGEARK